MADLIEESVKKEDEKATSPEVVAKADEGTDVNKDEKRDRGKKEVKLNRDDLKHKVLTSNAKMYLKPHKGEVTKDYLTMVRQEKELKDRPIWDKSQNTLTLSMIESRRNLYTCEKLLEEKRKEFSKYCQLRDRQIADVMNKEKKLRELFEFFDEFVKDNIEKRERAKEKIEKERDTREKIIEEIEKVNIRLVHVKKLKEKMIKSIANNKKFEDYLIHCGKALPNIFSTNPEKIIERYELLIDVRNELSHLQSQEIETLQMTSKQIDEEMDDRSEQLIDLSNLLTDLYNRKQVAGQESRKWKFILKNLQSVAAELTLETEQAQAACDDLYQQVCRETGLTPCVSETDQNSEQMRVILERILELRQILKVARERATCNYSERPNSCMSRSERENPKPRTRP